MAFMDSFPNNFNMNRANTNPCTLVSLGFVVCVFCLVVNEALSMSGPSMVPLWAFHDDFLSCLQTIQHLLDLP
jgi:hypothetical protein